MGLLRFLSALDSGATPSLASPPSMWPTLALPSPQVAARRRAWRELILALYRRAMFIREAKLGASPLQLAHPDPTLTLTLTLTLTPTLTPNP